MIIASLPTKEWQKVFLNNNKEVIVYPFKDNKTSYVRFTVKGVGDESIVDTNWSNGTNPNKILVVDKIHAGKTTVTIEFINISEIKNLCLTYWTNIEVRLYKNEDLVNKKIGKDLVYPSLIDITKIVITNFDRDNQGLWLFDNRYEQPTFYRNANVLKEKVVECFDTNKLFKYCTLRQEE